MGRYFALVPLTTLPEAICAPGEHFLLLRPTLADELARYADDLKAQGTRNLRLDAVAGQPDSAMGYQGRHNSTGHGGRAQRAHSRKRKGRCPPQSLVLATVGNARF